MLGRRAKPQQLGGNTAIALTEADVSGEEIVNCALKKLVGVIVRNVTASRFLIPIKFMATGLGGGGGVSRNSFFLFFLLIKIPKRALGALLPRPPFLSSMVKYVNKMSKVILQRGTKEKRGLREKTAIKFLRFSITLARGGPASSQSLAAGEPARSIESHIANPTHKKK